MSKSVKVSACVSVDWDSAYKTNLEGNLVHQQCLTQRIEGLRLGNLILLSTMRRKSMLRICYSTNTQAPHLDTALYFFRIFFCAFAKASWIGLPPSQAE
jgi:hypothetical protein